MIKIDVNEPQDIVRIMQTTGLDVQREHLEVGDILVEVGNMVVPIERKEINDYIHSIVDGRLSVQTYKMSEKYNLSIIAVVGYISIGLQYSKFTRDAFFAHMAGVVLKRAPVGESGVILPIVFETDYDLALFVKHLHRLIEKGDFVRLPVPKAKKTDWELSRIAMLMCIPGIGEERAKLLLKHFGSVYRVLNATPEQLMAVQGIGKKTAYNIYSFLRGGGNE